MYHRTTVLLLHVSICAILGSLIGAHALRGFALPGLLVGVVAGLLTCPIVIWSVHGKELQLAMLLLYATLVGTLMAVSKRSPAVQLLVLALVLCASSILIRWLMPLRFEPTACAWCGYPRSAERSARCSECGFSTPHQRRRRRQRWKLLMALLALLPVSIWTFVSL